MLSYQRKNVISSVLISICLVALAACGDDPSKLKTGKQLFEHYCSGCHGVEGKGIFLKGVPSNRDTGMSEKQVMHKMTEGDGGRMPVFENLTPEESKKIAEYLKSIEAAGKKKQ
jgi:mono/diheme cytochrome c family protein